MFSTFFYPQLRSLRVAKNAAAKEKVIKWSEDCRVFERKFVLFPIFEKYASVCFSEIELTSLLSFSVIQTTF